MEEAPSTALVLGHTDLVAVVNWLNPAASPRIVLSPIQTLSQY